MAWPPTSFSTVCTYTTLLPSRLKTMLGSPLAPSAFAGSGIVFCVQVVPPSVDTQMLSSLGVPARPGLLFVPTMMFWWFAGLTAMVDSLCTPGSLVMLMSPRTLS